MQPAIFLVDDDDAVRAALERLLEVLELPVVSCAAGPALLQEITPEHAGCIVLDLDLPGMNGLEVQRALQERGCRQPIIFLTGKGSVSSTARALKDGAFDFIEKPADSAQLIQRVQQALADDQRRRTVSRRRQAVQDRLALLTAREREVAELTVDGLSNKQIALRLGISHRTVEIHRSRVLHKLDLRSALDLARMLAAGAGVAAERDA